jgi:hypothetical protein
MENWFPTIATLVILVLGGFGILAVIKRALNESVEFLTALSVALSDNKLSAEELADLNLKFKDIIAAVKTQKEIQKLNK